MSSLQTSAELIWFKHGAGNDARDLNTWERQVRLNVNSFLLHAQRILSMFDGWL